jgi:hypothetical protein
MYVNNEMISFIIYDHLRLTAAFINHMIITKIRADITAASKTFAVSTWLLSVWRTKDGFKE